MLLFIIIQLNHAWSDSSYYFHIKTNDSKILFLELFFFTQQQFMGAQTWKTFNKSEIIVHFRFVSLV